MHPREALHPRFAVRVLLVAGLLAGCHALPDARVLEGPAPPSPERFCAWFGAASGTVLYFGEAAFWDRFRAAGGDPRADLLMPGPVRIGRFDLARGRFLEPVPVAASPEPGGTWDVLPRERPGAGTGLRIWFTTYFGPAGFIDLPQGQVRRLPEAGPGLNELAPGPGETVVATRYGRPDEPARGAGSLVLLGPDGRMLDELPLEVGSELLPLPKSVAFDPGRGEFWVNTDLVDARGLARGHDARILDRNGRELVRYAEPELQFPFFDREGRGYLAERAGRRLWLRLLPPGRPGEARPEGRRVLLDDAFPAGFDFVQEVVRSPGGPAVVTRWSGIVHLVDPARPGAPRRIALPRPDPEGLYYSAVLRGRRLCATYCAGVRVTCVDLDEAVPGDVAEARGREAL